MSQLKIDKNALSAVEGQLKASRSDIVNSLTNIIKVSNSLAAINIFASPIYMAGIGEDDEPIKDYREEARSYIKYAKKINSNAKDILNVQDDLTDVIEKINSILNAIDEFEGQSMSLDNIVPKSMEITSTGFSMGTGLGFANVTEEGIKLDEIAANNSNVLATNNEETGITKVDDIFNKENIIDTNGKVSENVSSNWNNLDGVSEVNLEEVGVDIKPSMSLFSMNKEEGLGGTLAITLGTGVVGGIKPLIDFDDDDKAIDKKISIKDTVNSKDEDTNKIGDTVQEEVTPIITEDNEEINITSTSDIDKIENVINLNTEPSKGIEEKAIDEEIGEKAIDTVIEESIDKQDIKLQEKMDQENDNAVIEEKSIVEDIPNNIDMVEYSDKSTSDDVSKDTNIIKDVESNKEKNKNGVLVTNVIDLTVDDTINDDSIMAPMTMVKETMEVGTPVISNVSNISLTLEPENNNPFSSLDTNDKNGYNNNLNVNGNGQNISNNVSNNVNSNVNNSMMSNNINGNIDSRLDNVTVKYDEQKIGENVGLNSNLKYVEKPGTGEFILSILMMIVIVAMALTLKYLNYINYIAFGLLLIANALLFISYISIRSKKMKAYKMYMDNVNKRNVNNNEEKTVGQQVMVNNNYMKTFGNGSLGQNNTLIMNEVEIMQQNQLNGNRQ